jgi:DNA polymerase-3 subunit beta
MKFTCERDKISSAFHIAASVAPSRSPKPILQNVKLLAQDGEVTLSATDMEIGVRITVSDMEVAVPGSAVVPVARFGSILRESSDAKLVIENDHQGTTIRGDRSEFRLPAENPDEFPEIARFEEEAFFRVNVRSLRELIRRTLFATDTESSRYALGGVLLEFGTDTVTAVGTDSRRLARMVGPLEVIGEPEGVELATIVPAKSMQMIERAFSDSDGEVDIVTRANDILLRSAYITIFSRLVEGRYPKWREVFPKRQSSVQTELVVGPFHSALRQAAIVASEESRGINLAFSEGAVVLSGSTAEVGQARVEMPVPYQGPEITLSLDHRYVADFLKVLDPEKTFTLDIENAEAAALFTTEDGYGYVVMPLARDR